MLKGKVVIDKTKLASRRQARRVPWVAAAATSCGRCYTSWILLKIQRNSFGVKP